MTLVDACSRIIRFGFYLLFLAVPLLLTPWNYELFEYNKMMATYGLTALIIGAWLVKMVAQKEIRIKRTPLDIPIALFLLSQFLATIFSMDPHVSWFGYYSRFNGGMWSVICYVLLYYAFVTNIAGNIVSFLKLSIFSGVLVSLYGVAERLGIDKTIWVQDVQNRVFSTLGQPNWLAAYLVALFPVSLAFAINAHSPSEAQKRGSIFAFWIWELIALLFFLVLLFTRSRSGLLGFAVADIAFWGLSYFKFLRATAKKNPDTTLRVAGVIHVLLALLLFVNGSNIAGFDSVFSLQGIRNRISLQKTPVATSPATYVGPLLETGGTESGTIRKYVWQGAVNAWKSSTKTMLIGTGTETFAFAFYQFRPKEHNLTSEWDFLYNKAHNEYLNYLATTGIFGLGSYLLFLGTFIWFMIKQIRNPKSEIRNNPQIQNEKKSKLLISNFDIRYSNLTELALFSGWLSLLVTNFFGFSVVTGQLFLFLFPAIIIAETRDMQQETWYAKKINLKSSLRTAFIITLLLALLALLVLLARFWQADTDFAYGYRLSRAGQSARAQPPLVRAIEGNPGEPLYHDELGTVYASLTVAAIQGKDATSAATFLTRSLAENDSALKTSPKNINFWKSRTKIYYTLSEIDPQYNQAAIAALERSRALSPNDPKIYYNLAILYGRAGNNDRAIELLQHGVQLKKNYRDIYYALFLFYNEVKKPDLARDVLRDYLTTIDPNDKDFTARLGK